MQSVFFFLFLHFNYGNMKIKENIDIPVNNAENTIDKAIDTALNQSYKEITDCRYR